MQVIVRDNNIDQALRVLKKKMQREGVFREMKRRRVYEKPSEKANREQAEAIRRARKLARKKAQREGLIAARSQSASSKRSRVPAPIACTQLRAPHPSVPLGAQGTNRLRRRNGREEAVLRRLSFRARLNTRRRAGPTPSSCASRISPPLTRLRRPHQTDADWRIKAAR